MHARSSMSTLPPAGNWARENSIVTEPISGRTLIQLTTAVAISHHIYPEAQAFTPDGKRTAFWRLRGPETGRDIFLADLERRAVRPLTDEALKGEGTCLGPAISPDGEWLYYVFSGRQNNQMRRVHLDTFERQALWELPDGSAYPLGSISPDGQYYVTGLNPPGDQPQVIRVDLASGSVEVIYSSPHVWNPHPVWDPSASGWLLVQENTGYERSEYGSRLVDGLGARLLVMRGDGSDVRQLDLGRRENEWIQGHQTWLGRRGEVVATAVRRPCEGARWRSDAVFALTPDGGRRTVATGYAFCHIGADASGRWICCDVSNSGYIFLIDADSGCPQFVCASGSSFGAAQYTHPHPAIGPDARWLVFNSDRTGIAQLYAVDVSDITHEA